MQGNQSGFTLIEIAIVLVIIGLLLGGVLKGQELINSAKVKNIATDFRNIPVFIYGYQDKYRALPGDQTQASLDAQFTPTNTGSVCTPALAGSCATANGVIEGNWNAITVASESFLFWQHARLAGFAPGPTATVDANYLPVNASGGKIGIQSGTSNVLRTPINATAGVNAIRGTYVICSASILGKFVKQLDLTMDDNNTASGSMMAGLATEVGTPMVAVSNVNIDEALAYTVCMGI